MVVQLIGRLLEMRLGDEIKANEMLKREKLTQLQRVVMQTGIEIRPCNPKCLRKVSGTWSTFLDRG